jgi:Mor family transcriptional regulator
MKRQITDAELVRKFKDGRTVLGLARHHGMTVREVYDAIRRYMKANPKSGKIVLR